MAQLKVAFTINWEGRGLGGVETLTRLRERFPRLPVTHFVSAAYFARGGDYQAVISAMAPAFAAQDEVGVLLNTWQSIHGSALVTEDQPRSVIAGGDPRLEINHPGVAAQQDQGYTRALSGFPAHHIDAWMRNSRILLSPLLKHLVQQPGLSVDAVLRGVRAGHGMGSDAVLELARAAGFAYDASAFDATWAQRQRVSAGASRFGPWPGMLADLWGPDEPSTPDLANGHCRHATAATGVDWRTQPFYILSGERGELLEMPINGGLIPPVTPAHVLRIAGALAKLPLPGGSYLSFGIHQDTADRDIATISERTIDTIEREYDVNWSTLAAIASELRGDKSTASYTPHNWTHSLRPPVRH